MFSAEMGTDRADLGNDGPSSSHAAEVGGTAAPVSGWGSDFLKVIAAATIAFNSSRASLTYDAIPCIICEPNLSFFLIYCVLLSILSCLCSVDIAYLHLCIA